MRPARVLFELEHEHWQIDRGQREPDHLPRSVLGPVNLVFSTRRTSGCTVDGAVPTSFTHSSPPTTTAQSFPPAYRERSSEGKTASRITKSHPKKPIFGRAFTNPLLLQSTFFKKDPKIQRKPNRAFYWCNPSLYQISQKNKKISEKTSSSNLNLKNATAGHPPQIQAPTVLPKE